MSYSYSGEEGFGANVLCHLCESEHSIANEREQAHKGIKRAAEKMVDATAKRAPLLEIGNSVYLNVPKVDRGPLDTKNVLGKVVDTKNGVYKIGTASGTIKNWFSRQDLQISGQDYSDVILESPNVAHIIASSCNMPIDVWGSRISEMFLQACKKPMPYKKMCMFQK